ncbi:MAG: hypothetical protein IPM61_05965 [Chlorobi bacterium]|nr:hypothetical protein [Chlorobiota bacterium]MBX7216123.1 hypothetical protein [Candidatus Kapabacteria bacterium]
MRIARAQVPLPLWITSRYPRRCGRIASYPQVFQVGKSPFFRLFGKAEVILNSYPLFHILINQNNRVFISLRRDLRKGKNDRMIVGVVKLESAYRASPNILRHFDSNE